MGDVVFRGFQCLRDDCQEFIAVREDEIGPKLKALARLTGYGYALLCGRPVVNDEAVAEILADPDAFIEEWIAYPEDIKRIRKMIQEHTDTDIFGNATHVPDYLRESDDGEG